MIPPEQNAEFVYRMEQVLDIYHRPFDPDHPVICMDESPNQLIGDITPSYRTKDIGKRSDYEYVRNGVASIFLACNPLVGWRKVEVFDSHKTADWVAFIYSVFLHFINAKKITLILDNLSTHKPAAFYEYYQPELAKKILDKINFVYTPKHGSWLNIAEIELNVLKGQCLSRRIKDKQTIIEQVEQWQKYRNETSSQVDWQFSTTDARIKLKRLYPKIAC